MESPMAAMLCGSGGVSAAAARTGTAIDAATRTAAITSARRQKEMAGRRPGTTVSIECDMAVASERVGLQGQVPRATWSTPYPWLRPAGLDELDLIGVDGRDDGAVVEPELDTAPPAVVLLRPRP
jgi:hypothetical protein